MQPFACAVAGLILLGAGFARAEPPTFNTIACSLAATDIVVTDSEGRVLETWRGGLQPGDTVRLGALRQKPANALPMGHLRLRPDPAVSGLYRQSDPDQYRCRSEEVGQPAQKDHWFSDFPTSLPIQFRPAASDRAENSFRLVMFLRKESMPGLQPIWRPATRLGWREFEFESPVFHPSGFQRHERDDFSGCIAQVEGGRVLGVQQDPLVGYYTTRWLYPNPVYLVPLANTLQEFKEAVMRHAPGAGEGNRGSLADVTSGGVRIP